MSDIQRHQPGPRMSQAVVHNGVVYLAGQVGEGADAGQQTRAILQAIDALLETCGSNKSRILSTQIFLADIADFAAMHAVLEAWIDPASPPARATIEAKLAAPRYLVEILVVAAQNAQ